MLGGKVAVDSDANVYPILVVSGEALAFGFWPDGEEGELIVFQDLLLSEEERQTQPRPEGRQRPQRFSAKVAALDWKRLRLA